MTGVPFKRILDTHPNARLAVEIAFGADLAADPAGWTWTDVTTDVRFSGRVSISPMGRSDNAARAQPAGCSFQLRNSSGDYSKGPSSRHFPYVRRNTPVRVRATLDGTNWTVRFQGQANGFTPGWDAMGKLPYVTVSASGVLRRLMQGTTPLRSPLHRAVSALSPLAHWPLEDGRDATLAGSAVTGVPSLTVNGTVGFSTVDIPGALPAPDIAAGSLAGSMPAGSSTSWAMYTAFRATRPAGEAANVAYMLRWGTTDGDYWTIEISNFFDFDGSPPRIIAHDYADKIGISVNGTTYGIDPYDGAWHNLLVQLTDNGDGTITMDLYVDDQSFTSTETATLAPLGGQVFAPDGFITIGTDSLALSNVAFVETASAPIGIFDAANGYVGESATDRIARLCAEEGAPVDVRVNADAPSPAMGAQGVDTFVNLLRECEITDDGVLYDGRGPGLAYASRGVRYNAATALTVDAAADQLAGPFNPVDDDQRNRNKVTVTRKGGATTTVEDADGPLGTATIGVYDSKVSPDPNYVDDSTNVFRAAWEVGKGTVEADYRYPSLALDLCAVPALAADWLAADVSSRIDVTNVDSAALTHPAGDIDLLLEGWSEIVAPNEWTAGCNCSPFGPYRVAVIEGAGDTVLIIDSASSVLDADAPAGATTMSVASDPVELWSTVAGDYPRAVDVGGVQVTVTAVSGASSPQTFTVDALPYALAAGVRVKLWRPATIAL